MPLFKQLLFVLWWTIVSLQTAAQQPLNSVEGQVLDSISKTPLKYATVTLISSTKPKKVLTDEAGRFLITNVPSGDHQLNLSSLGFLKKELLLHLKVDQPLLLGKIYLMPLTTQLKDVVIKADKPLVSQEIDRLIYDVQADPDSKGRQAIDIIRKVPLLSIGADGKLKLKGEGNFRVLLNGRVSSMTEHNLESFLSSLPAEVLAKVEVITTPPARYESEGLEGIINIVLGKRKLDGYNGSAQASYNTLGGPRATATGTLKEKKLIVFGSILYSEQDPIESTSINSRKTTFGNISSDIFNTGRSSWNGRYISSAEELSYELDTHNLITATFAFNKLKKNQQSNQELLRLDNESPIYSYLLLNEQDVKLNGLDLGLNYQRSFQSSKEKILTGSFKRVVSRNSEFGLNEVSSILNYPDNNFNQRNKYGLLEQTFQIDYTQPLSKKISMEGGGKIILRNNHSDFRTNNFLYGDEEQSNNSNIFKYQQDIFALYNSWQVRVSEWGMRAGLRIEHTMVDGDFVTDRSTVNDDYTHLIPSVSVQRRLPDKKSLVFGYSQRIQRPGISQLNPFRNIINSLNYQFGNPELRPVLNHSFELNFSSYKKASVYIGTNYSFSNNTIQNVITLTKDTISLSSFENIGKNRTLGSNIYFKYPFIKGLEFELNGRLSHISIEGMVRGDTYKNEGFQGNISSDLSFTFPANFRSSIEFGYNSSRVILQGRTNPLVSTTVSAVKDLLHKKATFTLFIRNPFQKFFTYTNYLTTGTFTQQTQNTNYYRGVDMLFVYRFGRLKDQVIRNKRGINNDDKI